MILEFKMIKNKPVRRLLEHIFFIIIQVVLIPAFLYFELCVVQPAVLTDPLSNEHYFHYLVATIFTFNIVGNLIFGAFTNTTIKRMYVKAANNSNWSFCSVCECMRPPRAWHCQTCEICVLKRDHHCTFLATCVGYYNHRYFILFIMHIFLAMSYSFYYNIQFLLQNFSWNKGILVIKILLPMIHVFYSGTNLEGLYLFLIAVNFVVVLFTGFLFFYHIRNVFRGRTDPERKHSSDKLYDYGWKTNLIEVFGTKWYLTWIIPFVRSPLPGNGLEWNSKYA